MKIKDLIIGNVYTSLEYSKAFKCSYMGGMNFSKETNSLVLISKQKNGYYDDKWDHVTNILHYTGQGQVGDQTLTRANKQLYYSKRNGIKVYLFEVVIDKQYIYQGEVELVSEPYQVYEEDINGNKRKVWKFPIRKVNSSLPISEKQLLNLEENIQNEVKSFSGEQIKEKALSVDGKVEAKPVITVHRSRNAYVSKYVKTRAQGKCDLCGMDAPFISKDNTPYLESHHVITLSDNGPDVVYNAVALCPNCHRKMHALEDPEDIEKLSKILLKYLLADEDNEMLEKYYKLFEGNDE